MLRTSWPAPPTQTPPPFPWHRFTLPGSTGEARPATRSMCLPLDLKGIALRFAVWFVPQFDTPRWNGKRIAVLHGALDESLAHIEAGKVWSLRLGHRDNLAVSTDGCMSLRLSRDGSQLLFKLRSDTEAGAAAMYLIRGLRAKELSIGLNAAIEELTHDSVVVTRAEITEVTATPHGSCPGCEFTNWTF